MNHGHDRNPHWLVLTLIGLGVIARLVPHPPNATPLMAIALFGGTYLAKRWAVLLPLIVVVISDAFLGWHTTMPFSWAALTLTGALAWWIRSHPSATRILCGALGGSVLFFVVTNFGVWLVGELYPRTIAGLWQCYVAAIPFFRNMVAGDLAYTTALFGSYALATGAAPPRHSVRSG